MFTDLKDKKRCLWTDLETKPKPELLNLIWDSKSGPNSGINLNNPTSNFNFSMVLWVWVWPDPSCPLYNKLKPFGPDDSITIHLWSWSHDSPQCKFIKFWSLWLRSTNLLGSIDPIIKFVRFNHRKSVPSKAIKARNFKIFTYVKLITVIFDIQTYIFKCLGVI